MRHTFEEYKEVATQAFDLMLKTNMNTRGDMMTIYHFLMLFPYLLGNGTYVYKFENYKTYDELPDEAKHELETIGVIG